MRLSAQGYGMFGESYFNEVLKNNNQSNFRVNNYINSNDYRSSQVQVCHAVLQYETINQSISHMFFADIHIKNIYFHSFNVAIQCNFNCIKQKKNLIMILQYRVPWVGLGFHISFCCIELEGVQRGSGQKLLVVWLVSTLHYTRVARNSQ